eukprot:m51a1_g14029 hypothetical protein (313) ;mRNA; f:1123497-1124496
MERVVSFNVGGVVFSTTPTTLHSRGENFLTRLLAYSDSGDSSLGTLRDEAGRLFIDRSPAAFGVVLDLLRTGRLVVPPSVSEEQVRMELEYYQIDPPAATHPDEAAEVPPLPSWQSVVQGRRTSAVVVTTRDILSVWRAQAREFVRRNARALHYAATVQLLKQQWRLCTFTSKYTGSNKDPHEWVVDEEKMPPEVAIGYRFNIKFSPMVRLFLAEASKALSEELGFSVTYAIELHSEYTPGDGVVQISQRRETDQAILEACRTPHAARDNTREQVDLSAEERHPGQRILSLLEYGCENGFRVFKAESAAKHI